mgnify:CR=1 FL=1
MRNDGSLPCRFRANRLPWMLLVMGLVVIATPVAADPIVVPTSLNPGDQYRLAFVTSTTGVATSTDIADYNSFVTAAANLEPLLVALGTSWNVIGGTLTVSARTNTATDPTPPGDTGVPIYLVNDTKLVDHYDDLWDGNIDIPFNINENADAVTSFVFTGSSWPGTIAVHRPLGFNGSEGTSWIGQTSFPTIKWMIGGTESDTTRALPFYAISGVLIVPEPGSLVLTSIGAVGLIGFGRRRRKRSA